MKIKLNKDLNGYKAGDVITLEDKAFEEKVYWLRRLEDAKIDKCCEVAEEKNQSNKKCDTIKAEKQKDKK